MATLNGAEIDHAAQEFGQLSDKTRLSILVLLSKGPKNVTALCEALDMKQPSVSHHLGLLRRVGLVSNIREGKSVVYEINRDMLVPLRDMLAGLTSGVPANPTRPVTPQRDVASGLEALRDEVETELEVISRVGRKAFDAQDYEKAREVSQRAAALVTFRDQVEQLRGQWKALVAGSEDEEDEDTRTERRNLGRLDRGLRTPESEYYRPILQALVEMGGSGRVAEVLERVGELMQSVLREVDHEPLESHNGAPRWRNAAQWARNSMVNDGLLKGDSPRGIWEITDQGRRLLSDG